MLREESQQSLLVVGKVPCPLQCVDRTTAENVLHCEELLESQVMPALASLSQHFPLCVCMPCTDRAPENLAAEKAMAKKQQKWVKSHTYCTTHKVSTCQKTSPALMKGHERGFLSVALCMQQAGSRDILRKQASNQDRGTSSSGISQCRV